MTHLSALLAALALALPIGCFAASPYAGEQARSIKALSEQEIADYVAGKGMGFAKAAELNGYPGPLHVLELATELELTPEQKQQTEAVFQRMHARASNVGRQLVDEEKRLDALFASKSVSPALLRKELDAIAALQADIRDAHLQAHLAQTSILSEAQAMQYRRLRGYGDDGAQHRHKH